MKLINIMEHKIIDSSLNSILRVTIPIILSVMSENLMYIIDRFILAGYSTDSMSAATISGTFVSIFTLMTIGISSSAEIFTGQYNGSKQYDKLVAPVWQMIYMSLAMSVLFVPLGYFSDYINALPHYYKNDGVEYQRILMYFAILPPLKVALGAFFIGQGKTRIITYSVVSGAILNILLDYLLIYGAKKIIPSMGCRGAAIATIISEFVSIVILAAVFFNGQNRKMYKTFENRKFNKELFLKCVKIGTPISWGNCMTLAAWYVIQALVSHVSKDAATIYNIGVNLYVFFIFIGDGVNKAVTTICSNMIGQGDLEPIKKTRRIFVAMSIFFGLVIAIPLICFPKWILSFLDMSPELYSDVKVVLFILAINVTLETLLLSTWGILIAGGDTRYTAIVYQICLWSLTVLPISILYYMNALNSVPMVYIFITLWTGATQFFIYKRYKSLKWYNKVDLGAHAC